MQWSGLVTAPLVCEIVEITLSYDHNDFIWFKANSQQSSILWTVISYCSYKSIYLYFKYQALHILVLWCLFNLVCVCVHWLGCQCWIECLTESVPCILSSNSTMGKNLIFRTKQKWQQLILLGPESHISSFLFKVLWYFLLTVQVFQYITLDNTTLIGRWEYEGLCNFCAI